MKLRTLETKHEYVRFRAMLNVYKNLLSMSKGVSLETWSTVKNQELIFEGLTRSINILEEKMAEIKDGTEITTKYQVYKRTSHLCHTE